MKVDEAKNLSTANARKFLKKKFGRYATFERLTAFVLAKVDDLERQVVELELRLAATTKSTSKSAAKTAKKK